MTTGITNIEKTVTIFLKEAETLAESYDKIHVYKSWDGVSGTYVAITNSSAQAATLISAKKELFSLDGLSFTFYANGVVKTATFTTEQTASEVAAKIQSDTGVTAAADGSYVRLTSTTTGLNSTLEVRDSTEGGVAIGFYQDDYDIGEALWIPLLSTTQTYTITDYNGSDDYWYKYRLYDSATATYSAYSTPFQARSDEAVSSDNIIYGTLQLVDSKGIPVNGAAVIITQKFLSAVEGKLVDGGRMIYYTDTDGKISAPVVKGTTVSLSIENTHLVRDISVPTTGSSFSLLGSDVQQYDSLGIDAYDITDMERTSF